MTTRLGLGLNYEGTVGKCTAEFAEGTVMQIVPQILPCFTVLSTKTRHFKRKIHFFPTRGLVPSPEPSYGGRGIPSPHPTLRPNPAFSIRPLRLPTVPATLTPTMLGSVLLKAKFHYASWVRAGSKLVRTGAQPRFQSWGSNSLV